MKIAACSSSLLLVLTTASNLTSKPSDAVKDPMAVGPRIFDGHPSEILTGGTPGVGYAKVDSVYLMGGPDRDDGDFEDLFGLPEWEGWASIDKTFFTINFNKRTELFI